MKENISIIGSGSVIKLVINRLPAIHGPHGTVQMKARALLRAPQSNINQEGNVYPDGTPYPLSSWISF